MKQPHKRPTEGKLVTSKRVVACGLSLQQARNTNFFFFIIRPCRLHKIKINELQGLPNCRFTPILIG